MKTFFTLLTFLISLNGFSQTFDLKDVSVVVDTREDSLPDRDVLRTQGRVRIGFTIDASGVVEIVGLATTGSSFNNDWATIRNENGTTDKVALAFRQLYLRKVIGKYTVEGGALNPEPSVGGAGLGASGWMDGVRVSANTSFGKVKIVAGSLGSFKEQNAFEREHDLNFIEMEVEYKLFEKLIASSAYENFNGDSYLRQHVQMDLTVLGDKFFKLFADALYDVERNAVNFDIGVEFDVLKNILHKYEKRLEMKVYLSHMDERIPNRSETVTAFYTYGPRLTTQIGGKITKDGKVSWNARGAYGKESRFDLGITFKFKNGKRLEE